mmetsp:Transcript_31886/g.63145  ORF Transcript_31886/g.63145 Transcript_31886/m.63145 type:complete len:224 (-) Transcript_31886:1237-1908(-)
MIDVALPDRWESHEKGNRQLFQLKDNKKTGQNSADRQTRTERRRNLLSRSKDRQTQHEISQGQKASKLKNEGSVKKRDDWHLMYTREGGSVRNRRLASSYSSQFPSLLTRTSIVSFSFPTFRLVSFRLDKLSSLAKMEHGGNKHTYADVPPCFKSPLVFLTFLVSEGCTQSAKPSSPFLPPHTVSIHLCSFVCMAGESVFFLLHWMQVQKRKNNLTIDFVLLF